MFTKPLDEIEFADIDEFCHRFPEGVRAEYKREVTAIPKVVSSFANTLGGIFLIGVDTDDNNDVVFPIQGMANRRGIEEQISESAFSGIYPPVIAEVKVVRNVPTRPDNVVVVIRVSESLQAPHAIENSTRVYIRVGSTTQPFKGPQLADIDRIDYMLKRREKPLEISNRILDRIEERLDFRWTSLNPRLIAIARPIFPFRPLISASEIYEFMRAAASKRHSLILFNDTPNDFGTWQVPGGVCFVGAKPSLQLPKGITFKEVGASLRYREINEYGIVYHAEELHRASFEASHGPEDDEENRYLELNDVVGDIYQLIAVAKDFYRMCQYSGNIEISAQLRNVLDERIMFGREPHYSSIHRRQSLQPEISAHIQCCARDLLGFDKSSGFIVELVAKLLWGFNAIDNGWENIVRERIDLWQKQYGAL